MTENRRFAYGRSSVDGYPCPAVAAGFDLPIVVGVESIHVAEQYDENLRSSPSGNGTVDEETAHDAWLDAIEYWDRTAEMAANPRDKRWHRTKAEIGREIARELGWL